jgi:hypothetical protein
MNELDNLTYTYDELSDVAKRCALEKLHDRFAPDHGWWDTVYESISEFGSHLGSIQVKGFDSNGGWIAWDGHFRFTDEALESMAQNYGGEQEQEVIAYMQETLALYRLSKQALGLEDNGLWADFGSDRRNRGTALDDSVLAYVEDCPLSDELYIRLVKIKGDMCDMFLKWLGDEYDYITSDEYAIERAEDYDVRFDEEGNIVDD